jgi:UDP-N-acetylglucosamine:LPS N-acetylglucosamine transferase
MTTKVDIVAIGSEGGHWEQLMLICEAFAEMDVLYVTTKRELLEQAKVANGRVVSDCNRDRPLETAKCLWQCARLIFSVRPKMVVTTGAAPGLLCLAMGKLIGAQTIWVESFANAEQLSLSGKIARHFASTRLTQWKHLSHSGGPLYEGELL